MIIRIAFYLSAILLALLPWHAFFITYLHSLFEFSFIFSIWKEIIIILLGFIFVFKWFNSRSFPIVFHKFDLVFIAFFLFAILTGFFITKDISQILWGLKYDYLFIILFYLIRGMNFSSQQKLQLVKIFFITAGLSLLLSLSFHFFLPENIYSFFGYSTQVSSYYPGNALPMYHLLGNSDIIRLSGTFSSPNHLAFYLMIILCFLPVFYKEIFGKPNNWLLKTSFVALLLLSICAVIITFTRSVYLALACLGLIVIIGNLKKYIVHFFIVLILIFVFVFGLIVHPQFQEVFLRKASSTLHLEKTATSVHQVIEHPFGVGIGRAGPASLRFEELQTTYVPTKIVESLLQSGMTVDQRNEIWLYDNYPGVYVAFKAKNEDELLNIPIMKNDDSKLGNIHEVHIPVLSEALYDEVMSLWKKYHYETVAENWHIQMFQEYGIIGGVLYLMFIYLFLQYLYFNRKNDIFSSAGFYALIGFLFAGLFLHVFENSQSVLTLFLLLGLIETKKKT